MSGSSHYPCLCFLFLLPLAMAVQRRENMTSGSYLTAGDNSSHVSPNGDFALGFQLAGDASYLAAIWFNRIPQKTIVWAANRDNLVPSGSKLQLTTRGSFVLTAPHGSTLWDANTTGIAVGSVALLDTGNLVFLDIYSTTVLWSSFDSPTDTILPTQVWQKPTSLVPRISPNDYSSGRYMLVLQPDGNLVFYTRQPQAGFRYLPAYDATGTSGTTDSQLVFNQSGSIYVQVGSGSGSEASVVGVIEDETDPTLFYQRATLEFDGVFRKYVYPRSPNSTTNWMVKGVRPHSICSLVTSGTGVCGLNSICAIGDDQLQRPICECPQGYSVLDQTDPMKGCNLNFTQQSCLEDPHSSYDKFVLNEMDSVNFRDSSVYDVAETSSEDLCKNSCMSDCYCAAVVYQDIDCKKMRLPLSYMWINKSEDILPSKGFIKLRIGNSTSNDPIIQKIVRVYNETTNHRNVNLVESIFLGSSIFLNILLFTTVVLAVTFCKSKRKPRLCDNDQDITGTTMRKFSYNELEEATNRFKEVVGQGAFSIVYKGILGSELIAVKKLNQMIKENQREFENEVKAIARTGHRNLVQLIGFCNEGEHRLLVYEYMPNGSLADILSRTQRPNLRTRIKFGLETAKGLNYLHEECSIQIIHCDIKLQNILLDDSLTARISDFGLAKLLKRDQAQTMTGIRGTKGYVAPEWFRNVPISTKVDVYSFGILLLELICCRRCFEAEMEDEDRMVLADWAYDCYRKRRIVELMEGDIGALEEVESVTKLVMIGLWCVQEEPSLRPSMNKVVQMISEALGDSQPQDFASHIIILI